MPSPPAFLRRFVETEAAGGAVLLVATVAALVWAGSPASGSYESFVHDAHRPVNDGLMTLFFFVVGLEIRRELVDGELRDRRAAALPVVAAIGGMVVPAAIYLAVNAGHPGHDGWGVPMATDIAFSVGVLSLLGRRVSASLRLFLLSLAIVDDIGAIVVIAVAYGGGVHPTIIGVAVALLVPSRPAAWLETVLHPVSTFVVVPLFALVNAGVAVSLGVLDAPGAGRVALGIGLGLVVGKLVGITAASWLAVRLRLASLPADATWPAIAGIAAIAGIGFTVSLFVTDLAFDGAGGRALTDAAKLAILAASVVAALVGAAVLSRTSRRTGPATGRP